MNPTPLLPAPSGSALIRFQPARTPPAFYSLRALGPRPRALLRPGALPAHETSPEEIRVLRARLLTGR